ncbi:MAG TPA: hypothetical protein VGR50_00595 [Terriglobales bacterium]|nr:hypothetical protein [Terriglobales bacterium]
MVLIAASVQTCHVCGLEGLAASHRSIDLQTQAAPQGGICPICLSSQPATSTAPVMALGPVLAITMVDASAASSFDPAETQFSLYTRPPPAR